MAEEDFRNRKAAFVNPLLGLILCAFSKASSARSLFLVIRYPIAMDSNKSDDSLYWDLKAERKSTAYLALECRFLIKLNPRLTILFSEIGVFDFLILLIL